MNWQTTHHCLQKIASMKRDTPQAIASLRSEVIACPQLSPTEKAEIHDLLDGLQAANMYGQISLVSRLKEIFSRHAEFKALYPEYGVPKQSPR